MATRLHLTTPPEGVNAKSLTTFVVLTTPVAVDSISTRIATARQLAGISAAHLGELSGLSRSAVALIESGERKDPGGSTVAAIAAALGVSTDWLLNGTGKAPTAQTVKSAVTRAETKTGTNG
jgi:ribosome-binding protein aMBF1 (putative translation factor)